MLTTPKDAFPMKAMTFQGIINPIGDYKLGLGNKYSSRLKTQRRKTCSLKIDSYDTKNEHVIQKWVIEVATPQNIMQVH